MRYVGVQNNAHRYPKMAASRPFAKRQKHTVASLFDIQAHITATLKQFSFHASFAEANILPFCC